MWFIIIIIYIIVQLYMFHFHASRHSRHLVHVRKRQLIHIFRFNQKIFNKNINSSSQLSLWRKWLKDTSNITTMTRSHSRTLDFEGVAKSWRQGMYDAISGLFNMTQLYVLWLVGLGSLNLIGLKFRGYLISCFCSEK